MPSVVGTWNMRVTWIIGPLPGVELNVSDPTFKADGTWNDLPNNHRGRWLQDGDQVVWTVTGSVGLLYEGTIPPGPLHENPLLREASMTGTMFWLDRPNRGSFRAERRGILPVPDDAGEVVLARGDARENNIDPVLGRVADPPLDDPSDDAAQDAS